MSFYKLSLYLYENDAKLLNGNYYNIVMSLWIIGWITQFIGHGKFEGIIYWYNYDIIGRAPALLTNLFYVFVAPFFAVFEVIFI